MSHLVFQKTGQQIGPSRFFIQCPIWFSRNPINRLVHREFPTLSHLVFQKTNQQISLSRVSKNVPLSFLENRTVDQSIHVFRTMSRLVFQKLANGSVYREFLRMSHLIFQKIGRWIGPPRFSENAQFNIPEKRSINRSIKIFCQCPIQFFRILANRSVHREFLRMSHLVFQKTKQWISPSRVSHNVPFSFLENQSIDQSIKIF